MLRWISPVFASTCAALAFSGNALAGGGNYTFSGGSEAERTTVRRALAASAFPWSIVPQQITIKIGKGFASEAVRGTIWLDSDLLHAGKFAWGTIQHEYAHQVDFFLLDDAKRTVLAPRLGGKCWWQTCSASHDQLTSERFASTLAWSYWPSSSNTMKPESPTDESAALKPAAFRALLHSLLPVPQTLSRTEAPGAAEHVWTAPTKASKPKAKRPKPKVKGKR